MENEAGKSENTNWTQPSQIYGYTQELPNATLSMILGIVGLALSLCFGCGLVGFILSIIAFVKGKKAVKEYENNPTIYSEKLYGQAKAGKIIGLIGLILGIIVIGLITAYLVVFGIFVIAGETGSFD